MLYFFKKLYFEEIPFRVHPPLRNIIERSWSQEGLNDLKRKIWQVKYQWGAQYQAGGSSSESPVYWTSNEEDNHFLIRDLTSVFLQSIGKGIIKVHKLIEVWFVLLLLMSLSGLEMTKQEKNSSTALLSSRKHLSSLVFFFISVYSNFTIQYNVFEFNKLQWVVLLVGGVILWMIPFIIEKMANKMIITLVSGKPVYLTRL